MRWWSGYYTEETPSFPRPTSVDLFLYVIQHFKLVSISDQSVCSTAAATRIDPIPELFAGLSKALSLPLERLARS